MPLTPCWVYLLLTNHCSCVNKSEWRYNIHVRNADKVLTFGDSGVFSSLNIHEETYSVSFLFWPIQNEFRSRFNQWKINSTRNVCHADITNWIITIKYFSYPTVNHHDFATIKLSGISWWTIRTASPFHNSSWNIYSDGIHLESNSFTSRYFSFPPWQSIRLVLSVTSVEEATLHLVRIRVFFLTQFKSLIRLAQLEKEWKACCQREDETLNEFVVRLRSIWLEIKPNENEAHLLTYLLCKMRSDLLAILGICHNLTLDQILERAQTAEHILFLRGRDEHLNHSMLSSLTTQDLSWIALFY